MSPEPTNIIGRADFTALVEAITAAVAERLDTPLPQLLDQTSARKYLGLSRSGWFRAKSADLLPKPLFIEGSGERWRRKDLDGWLERQRPRRK
jgi:predicted DNA-binding transcriptional regulator AlpA